MKDHAHALEPLDGVENMALTDYDRDWLVRYTYNSHASVWCSNPKFRLTFFGGSSGLKYRACREAGFPSASLRTITDSTSYVFV